MTNLLFYTDKDGKITKEEAIHHPQKNMLMKALRM